eukprot:2611498-Pyramimonas_sp.AAC.1
MAAALALRSPKQALAASVNWRWSSSIRRWASSLSSAVATSSSSSSPNVPPSSKRISWPSS